MKLCQRIFWCLALLIFWQSFKSIGSIEQSSELQKVPNFCFAQNLIETYTTCQLLLFMFLPNLEMFTKLHFFSIQIIISRLEIRNFLTFLN